MLTTPRPCNSWPGRRSAVLTAAGPLATWASGQRKSYEQFLRNVAGLSIAGEQWRWLSLREVLDAWEPLLPDVETTDLFRLLLEVSDSPLGEMPGVPMGPAESIVRTSTGYGLEIAYVVVHPMEEYGLRLVNLRQVDDDGSRSSS